MFVYRVTYRPYARSQVSMMDKAHDWHVRISHIAMTSIQCMEPEQPCLGLPPTMASINISVSCGSYATGHMQRAPHDAHIDRPPPVDMAGPFYRTHERYLYFLMVTEMYDRYRMAYLLKVKL